MRVINISLSELETKMLMIGFEGENQITQVRIDAADILTDYPNATPTLIVKPLFGFAYPVIVAMEGTDVVWEIDNSVLNFHGDGEIQLTFTAGTVIAKSYVGRIRIKRSLAVNGEAPDPIETWEQAATAKLAEVDAQIGELEDMVEAAEAAKDQAQDIVDDAAADIQAAGAAQVQVVQAAGEEVLDSIPSDYTELSDDVTGLKSAIEELPETQESDAEDVDLDVTDRFGNVLLRLEDGHVKTKYFDSSEVSGGNGTQTEIDLSSYPTVNYNFEYGNTWTSGAYRGVLIPRSALGDRIKFTATSNKIVTCFLTDNDITASVLPHTCVGTTVIRMGPGADEILPVPEDCAYLYVYVSQNSAYIGTIHLYAITNSTKVPAEIAAIQDQINEMRASIAFAHMQDADQIVRTLKHWHTNTNNDFRAYTTGDDLVTIAHISDIHNDPTAYGRFISFLNSEVGVIDCGLVTGDIVDGPGTDCFAEMTDEEDALVEGTKLLKVVGNHDRISAPLDELFDYMNMGISTSGEELYYVHDFNMQKIRIIVLNQYDTTSGTLGKTGHYSQDQLDWFCAKLQEALTNGYQVIVSYHSCSEVGLPARNTKGFCQETYMGFNESVSNEHIVEDIVNAFQTAGSVNKSITYTDSGVTVSVNVSFASKGIFICYISGHAHVDFIGYSKVYPNQLVCMIQGAVIESTKRDEATAHWQGMYDTPRISGTSTANSINVYAFDTMARLVKVVKIGSTMTDKFVPRSFATFGY